MSEESNCGPPDFTIIIVSDRAAGEDASWDYLTGTLQGLARQTYSGPVEYLFIEHEATARGIPPALLAILPSLRVLPSPSQESFEMKNYGAQVARAGVLVVVDGDCWPEPDWLEQIAEAWRCYPDAAAISGHSEYPGRTITERLASILSRAYVDHGTAGPTRYVSNNNCSWRREWFLVHPLPQGLGPFAARIQSEAVIRAGGMLLYVPEIRVIHEYEGLRMEIDQRKNCGYGSVVTRLRDPAMPYARLIRMGVVSIPFVVAGRMIDQWLDALRCWRRFHLRFLELLLALILVPAAVSLEVPGMLAAHGHGALRNTKWR